MKLPSIVTGAFIPPGIESELTEKERAEAALKAQRKHDWAIATYGIIGGGVAGVASSLIFWLLTK